MDYEFMRDWLVYLGLPFTNGGGAASEDTVELQYLDFDGDWKEILSDAYLLEAQCFIEIVRIADRAAPEVLGVWIKIKVIGSWWRCEVCGKRMFHDAAAISPDGKMCCSAACADDKNH